jgi:hypothetical protein
MATNVVEIGFDLSGVPGAQFATLDDATLGVLDSAVCVLGGAIFQDVTPSVISYSINRGKSRQLDKYTAGQSSIALDNNTRIFDPLNTASPYSGQIIPKRKVRVTSNEEVQYLGEIDDWDLSYSPQGNSIAAIVASDGLALLANQTTALATATAGRTDEQLNELLTNSGVQWPTNERDLEVGLESLDAQVWSAGDGAVSQINYIVDSEPGQFFIAKNGNAVFKNRLRQTQGTPVLFADDGSGIPYTDLAVVYGSELLYNKVTVGTESYGEAEANDGDSQQNFRIQSLTKSGLPLTSNAAAQNLADFLLANYAQPEYRFESITVDITDLSATVQNQILNLELTDVVRVKFTPNNIPPAIDKYAEIIRISQTVTQTRHTVTLGLASGGVNFWQLSDLVFGRLSEDNALSY